MQKVLKLVNQFGKDEDGAALIEYTVLLGILIVAVIAMIIGIGGWVSTKWNALCTALSATC